MKAITAAALWALLLLGASAVQAVGLGELQVHSSLGEPLKATISFNGDFPEGVHVSLGKPEQYRSHGLRWLAALERMEITVERRQATARLAITSRAPIHEPALAFLVELRWRGGRLLKDYALLLDPVVASPPLAGQTSPAPANTAAPDSLPEPTDVVVVHSGDTLGAIAERVAKPKGTNTRVMMLGLYRANPDAFFGHNMNNLMAGARLRVPERSELEKVSSVRARQEVIRQYQDWKRGSNSSLVRTVKPQATPRPETTKETKTSASVEPAPVQAPPEPQVNAESPPAQSAPEPEAEASSSAPETREAALELLMPPRDAAAALPGEWVARLEKVREYSREMEGRNEELRTKLEALETEMQKVAKQVLAVEGERGTVSEVGRSPAGPSLEAPETSAEPLQTPVSIEVRSSLPGGREIWGIDRVFWEIFFAVLLTSLAGGVAVYIWRMPVPDLR